jgi:hypothetical protein
MNAFVDVTLAETATMRRVYSLSSPFQQNQDFHKAPKSSKKKRQTMPAQSPQHSTRDYSSGSFSRVSY